MSERRFPVLNDYPRHRTISWAEAEEAYVDYHRRFPNHQTLERIAERGGFDLDELRDHLGHVPETLSSAEDSP